MGYMGILLSYAHSHILSTEGGLYLGNYYRVYEGGKVGVWAVS